MDIQVSTVPQLRVWLQMLQVTGAPGSSLHHFCSKGVTGQMRFLNLKWHHYERLAFKLPTFIRTAASEQRNSVPVRELAERLESVRAPSVAEGSSSPQ